MRKSTTTQHEPCALLPACPVTSVDAPLSTAAAPHALLLLLASLAGFSMLSDPQHPTWEQKGSVPHSDCKAGNQPTGINHPHPQPRGYHLDSNALHQAAAGCTEHSFKLVKSQLPPRIRDVFGSIAAFKSFPVVH